MMNLDRRPCAIHEMPSKFVSQRTIVSPHFFQESTVSLVDVPTPCLSRERLGNRNIQDEDCASLRETSVKVREPLDAQAPCFTVSQVGRRVPVTYDKIVLFQSSVDRFHILPTVKGIKHVQRMR